MAKPGPSKPNRKPLNPKHKGKRIPVEKKLTVNDKIEAELAKEAAARQAELAAEAEAAAEIHASSSTRHSAAAGADEEGGPAKRMPAKRAPDRVKARVVSVNERQIASDTLSLSGDRASDFIARISDVLQANGKIIVTVVVLAVIVGAGLFVFDAKTAAAKGEYAAEVANSSKVKADLKGAKRAAAIKANFEKLTPGDDPYRQAEYWYQYAESYFGALISARSQDSKKMTAADIKKDNAEIYALFGNYRDVVEKHPDADPASKDRLASLTAYQTQLERDATFRASRESRFSEHTEYWESEEGLALTKTHMIDAAVTSVEKGNPEVVFATKRGNIRVRLFELTKDITETDPKIRAELVSGERKLLQNAIGLIIQLIERGYYDGQAIDGVTVPGVAGPDSPALNLAEFVEWGRRGMLERKAKAEEKAEDAEDLPKKEPRAPDFTILPEPVSSLHAKQGSVFQVWDRSTPLVRGTRLGVNLGPENPQAPGNTAITDNFQVIGEIVEGLDVAKSLRRGDVIWKAWVAQKRADTQDATAYLPRVIFMDESNRAKGKSQVPELWTEDQPVFVAPKVEKVDAPAMIKKVGDSWEATGEYNSKNPIVVLRTPKGDIVVELYEDQAPNTVKNFIYLIENKLEFLKETSFSPNSSDKTLIGGVSVGKDLGWTIASESREKGYDLLNLQGTLSMQYDNSPDGASSQFVINLDDNDSRDGKKNATSEKDKAGYTVFGRVVKNYWALSEFKVSDRIEDAWVVQRREGVEYVPMVTQTGDAGTKKATEIKATDD